MNNNKLFIKCISVQALLAFMFVFAPNAFAQTINAAITWSTSAGVPITTLSAAASQHWYYLSAGLFGSPIMAARIDGVEYTDTISGGGGALIFAKTIEVRQVSSNPSTLGGFATINAQTLSGTKVIFSAHPGLDGGLTLVASLDTARDFLISFDPQNGPQCVPVTNLIFVDGKPIVNSNKQPVTYLPQGGAIATGKIIEIQAVGNCGAATNYLQTGTFELL